jgi:hypothetical protein
MPESPRNRKAFSLAEYGTRSVSRRVLASLNRDASVHGRLGAAAGLPPDAIASHAEPAEVKADPREEVEVGQGGQP